MDPRPSCMVLSDGTNRPTHGQNVSVYLVGNFGKLSDTEVRTGRAALRWNNSRDSNNCCVTGSRTELTVDPEMSELKAPRVAPRFNTDLCYLTQ